MATAALLCPLRQPAFPLVSSLDDVDSTPSCATSLLSRFIISFWILFNLFVGVLVMLTVAVNWVACLQFCDRSVVVINQGFRNLSYEILQQIRAISCFGFLCVLLSWVCGNTPTFSWNLVFQTSLSCHVDSRILMFLMMAKNHLASVWLFQQWWWLDYQFDC